MPGLRVELATPMRLVLAEDADEVIIPGSDGYFGVLPGHAALLALLASDSAPTIWWGSPVECCSAFYRRHRDRPLPSPVVRQALARLDALVEDASVVAPTEPVRRRARRLLATHPLRALDAFQLAAALVWCQEQPAGESFVCLDSRLGESALAEGFHVLPE